MAPSRSSSFFEPVGAHHTVAENASATEPARAIAVMIVAVLTVHLRNGFFNTNGGYEFNLALVGMALTLLIVGAGAYSIDSALGIFW